MKGGEIIVKGNCTDSTGEWMEGGKIIVEKDCGDHTGKEMKGGEIIVKGNCRNYTGEEMEGGKIVVEGNCKDHTGEGMKNGEIIVEKDCGCYTGARMKGGTLIVKGKVESFRGISFPSNQGTVIWKGTKIWENRGWTKKGKEMANEMYERHVTIEKFFGGKEAHEIAHSLEHFLGKKDIELMKDTLTRKKESLEEFGEGEKGIIVAFAINDPKIISRLIGAGLAPMTPFMLEKRRSNEMIILAHNKVIALDKALGRKIYAMRVENEGFTGRTA